MKKSTMKKLKRVIALALVALFITNMPMQQVSAAEMEKSQQNEAEEMEVAVRELTEEEVENMVTARTTLSECAIAYKGIEYTLKTVLT